VLRALIRTCRSATKSFGSYCRKRRGISGTPTVRSEHGIKFSQRVPVELRSADARVRRVLSDDSRMIQSRVE
jgi:hypothetical protein